MLALYLYQNQIYSHMDSYSLSNLEESEYEPRKRLDEPTKQKALEIFKNP